MQFRTIYFVTSISTTLFDEILHASLIFHWPAAEPLTDAHGTLEPTEPRLKITALHKAIAI